MIIPTSVHKDSGAVGSITIRLDNKNTDYLKKFHCSVCGHIVFAYYDTIIMMVPSDNVGELEKQKNATEEIVCLNRWTDDKGYTNRCKTVYVIDRG